MFLIFIQNRNLSFLLHKLDLENKVKIFKIFVKKTFENNNRHNFQ